VRRIAAVAVVLATSAAIPVVAAAREYLSFGEARYQVRTLIRAEMKRNGGTYKEGTAEITCRRAPARLRDRASCNARWSEVHGTSFVGRARIVKYRTFYARSLHWRPPVCGFAVGGLAGLASCVKG